MGEAHVPLLELGVWQLLMLALPVSGVIGLSLWMRLGQARRIGWASLRATVQLLAVGLVIGWVFERNTWYWIIALLTVMTLVAGVTAGGQLGRAFGRMSALLSLVLGAATAVTLIYMTEAVIGLHAWNARYLIPLGGMLLGNAITAATLALERLASDLRTTRGDVQAYLALGATPWQAVKPAFHRAVAAALTPTINAMLVVGVVKLPGMMTGQMLGGSSPFQAAMYQLLILVGIIVTDMLSAVGVGALAYRRYFTPAWQIDHEALSRQV